MERVARAPGGRGSHFQRIIGGWERRRERQGRLLRRCDSSTARKVDGDGGGTFTVNFFFNHLRWFSSWANV
jgi:hypothetical protein